MNHIFCYHQNHKDWCASRLIKSAFYTNQPIFVFLYKETQFNTNDLEKSLYNGVIFLLQAYGDVFFNNVPNDLLPIRRIKHQIDFVPRDIKSRGDKRSLKAS